MLAALAVAVVVLTIGGGCRSVGAIFCAERCAPRNGIGSASLPPIADQVAAAAGLTSPLLEGAFPGTFKLLLRPFTALTTPAVLTLTYPLIYLPPRRRGERVTATAAAGAPTSAHELARLAR